MTSFQVFTLLLSLLAFQSGRIRAQMVSCKTGWEWMKNSANKDPCQMISSLDGSCLGTQLVIPKLPNGTVYAPPKNKTSPSAICDCNSPVYSLYSACAACQGAGWFKWSQWSAACGVAHVGVLPDSYFVTTPIPQWAFINVTVNGTFVPTTAKLIGGLPERPADGPKTTSLPTISSTLLPMKSPDSNKSSSSSDLPSATRTSTSKPKTPIGAIAGGVVGGAVLLFLVGFALLLFCKRRGLKIPKIRKASGPKSLFDSEERRPNLESEEAVAVNRPLLYDPTNPATFSRVNAELEKPLYRSVHDPHDPQPQPPI